jgi:hypothetical protein
MKRELVEKSIETGELQLEFWQKITHYEIVFYSIFLSLMFSAFYIYDRLNKAPKPFLNVLVWFIVIPAIIGIIFYFIQKNRLKFTIIRTNLSRNQIDEIVKEVSNKLEWHKHKYTKKIFIAKTFPGFFFR